MSKKILFISHDASRTGAPILLLNFLRWFKANSDIPFQILLREGGELASEFEAIAPTMVFGQASSEWGYIRRVFDKLKRRIHLQCLKNRLTKDSIGLIYSNTIVNGEILEFLSYIGCPVICHVHELEYWFYRYGKKNTEQIKKYTDQYIAASDAVKRNLLENHKIPNAKVETIDSFITLSAVTIQHTRDAICDELDIPREAFIVCASGTTDWRKAPDVFINLARLVHKRLQKPVHFIWVGGSTEGIEFYELMHDVKKFDLEKYVHFLGIKSKPFDYFAACDVFVVVSRDEPFSLVALEAAFLGKPLVCFEKSGGVEYIVGRDAGFTVPYLDTEAMAERIIELIDSSELRYSLGQRAKQKVERQCNVEVMGPKILTLIKQYLS